ncbi:hypothetical protein JYK22_38705, partial [Nonomuraea sp. RK-328]|nr:hypothetical protein [Nonomuraea sp. RK-328]
MHQRPGQAAATSRQISTLLNTLPAMATARGHIDSALRTGHEWRHLATSQKGLRGPERLESRRRPSVVRGARMCLVRLPGAVLRVVEEDAASVRWQLLGEFGSESSGREAETGRTVAELLDGAASRRHAREQQEAARRAEEQTRREQERRQARELRLNRLAQDLKAAWDVVEASIGTKKPREYDQAVELLRDLHALAIRDEHARTFTQRLTHLRERHQGKPSLIKRLDDAGLTAE